MKLRAKTIWLPLILAVYCAAISIIFGPGLIREGQAAKFWISVGIEAVVVIGLFFALRHKDRLSSRWNQIHRSNQ